MTALSPRSIARALDMLSVLVVISIALALAGLTWRLVIGGGGTPVATLPPPPAAPPVDVAPLVALAPFGAAGAGTSGALAPTTLPLVLKALFYAPPPAASTALIAANGQPPKSVAVGGDLAGLATIAAIAADHVLLNVGGQHQALYFPGKMKSLLGAAAQPAPATSPAPPPPAAIPPPAFLDSSAPPPANRAGAVAEPARPRPESR